MKPMKDENQILKEAPLLEVLAGEEGEKTALVCTACTWWTNSAKKCRRVGNKLLCASCNGTLRETPLEDLIKGTKATSPENFQAFLKAFSDNR